MNDAMLISLFAGVAVIALFVGLAFAFTKSISSQAEQRLEDLTSAKSKAQADLNSGILLRPPAVDLEQQPFWTKLIPNLENLTRLYEQADVNMPFSRFMGLVVALAAGGAGLGFALKLPIYVLPLCSAVLGVTPF